MQSRIVNEFIAYLETLTSEEREEVIGTIYENFCQHCGTKTGPRETCYCWNDE